MGFIESLQLSNITLLVLFALPFSYFAFHARYWYRPDALKKIDFLLSAAAIVLSGVVLFKGIATGKPSTDELILALLHLGPLVLTLLIVSQGGGLKMGTRSTAAEKKSGAHERYSPQPLNPQVEKLGWEDLVIDDDLREELFSVIKLLKDPETAKRYGVEVPKGILLNGPPGTGKTTIAKVMASSAGLAFFALKMDEVVSKWVGESEKNLSTLFLAAQKYAPAVIFIDEVDSIGKARSGAGQQWAENLLNHLLQLVDGVIKTRGLYIIAATNRADLVDPALRRAGRLSKTIEIPLPDFSARAQLFAINFSKLKTQEGIDLNELASVTEGRSGADIKEICNRAGLNAFKRESSSKKRDYRVTIDDVERALNEVLG